MKRFIAFCFLAVLVCIIPASQPAQAKSLTQVLASIPDFLFHGVTAVTDKGEYLLGEDGKIPYVFTEIDVVADAGVTFFHNLASPSPATVAAKVQAKAAKKAAKRAAKAQKK